MAHFTVWRIHECNANFLKTFLGDKARLVFWLTAFFLIFWVRHGAGAQAGPDDLEAAAEALRYNRAMTLSAVGAFLLLIETAYVANRLLGRTGELLAGWMLLTFPGFLLYARFGMYQPCAAAFACAAVLLAGRGRLTFGRMLFTGILCGLSCLCRSVLGGLILPAVCIWFLRGQTPSERKTGLADILLPAAGFLCGLAVLFLPLLPVQAQGFGFTTADWYSLYVQGLRGRHSALSYVIILAALVPWFWLPLPALELLNRKFRLDRAGSGRIPLYVMTVAFAVIVGMIGFGAAAILPFLALLSAWYLIRTADMTGRETRWKRRILNGACLFWSYLFPVLCFAVPFLFIRLCGHAGASFSIRQVGYFYFQFPAAGIAAGLAAGIALMHRKKEKIPVLPEKEGFMDRFVFILIPVLFLLVP